MRHRSVLSLPREILWDVAAGQLVSRPVEELASSAAAAAVVVAGLLGTRRPGLGGNGQ